MQDPSWSAQLFSLSDRCFARSSRKTQKQRNALREEAWLVTLGKQTGHQPQHNRFNINVSDMNKNNTKLKIISKLDKISCHSIVL